MRMNLNIRAKHVQVEGAEDASTDVDVHLKSVDPMAVITQIMDAKIPDRDRFALSKVLMARLSGIELPLDNTKTGAAD